jgi:TetR/AcrR family transcriptional repressor of nem operon
MSATGLKKGGIYNHFQSKDEIAVAAFNYAYSCSSKRIWQSVRQKKNAIERLQALVSAYLDYVDDPPIHGGCPIMNTAIESDDTHPILRDRVREVVNEWRGLICRIIEKGIKKGEINTNVEIEYKQALRLFDRPVAKMWLSDIGRLRFTMQTEIYIKEKVATNNKR